MKKIPGQTPRVAIPENPDMRQWEASRAGYLEWAVSRLIETTREPSEMDATLSQLGDATRETPSEVLGQFGGNGLG